MRRGYFVLAVPEQPGRGKLRRPLSSVAAAAEARTEAAQADAGRVRQEAGRGAIRSG